MARTSQGTTMTVWKWYLRAERVSVTTNDVSFRNNASLLKAAHAEISLTFFSFFLFLVISQCQWLSLLAVVVVNLLI